MSDGGYCGVVVDAVSNESSPSYDFWEEVKICYMGVFVSIPLSREGWVQRVKDLCLYYVRSDIVQGVWGM